MGVTNLNELVVAREYDRLVQTVEEFCGCGVCRDDVIVYALNRLLPHYVTEERGAIVQRVAMERDQQVADVAVALMNGFRVVGASPRPGHDRGEAKTRG
jgi:competence protein ComFB